MTPRITHQPARRNRPRRSSRAVGGAHTAPGRTQSVRRRTTTPERNAKRRPRPVVRAPSAGHQAARGAVCRAARTQPRTSRTARSGAKLASLGFRGLARHDGDGVVLQYARRRGGSVVTSRQVVEVRSAFSGASPSGDTAGRHSLGRSSGRNRGLSQALAALGHPVRLTVALRLLSAPADYASLTELTGLKAGPLYHHLNQLRLARLIEPKKRNQYELTSLGRRIALVAMAAGRWVTQEA